jgi:hypothetical protein
MRPACITTAALIVAGATSTDGTAALVSEETSCEKRREEYQPVDSNQRREQYG